MQGALKVRGEASTNTKRLSVPADTLLLSAAAGAWTQRF